MSAPPTCVCRAQPALVPSQAALSSTSLRFATSTPPPLRASVTSIWLASNLYAALPLPPRPPGQVWVDLGGGTGENVAMMSHYIDLSRFKQIYVVDLCRSLCQQVGPSGAGTAAQLRTDHLARAQPPSLNTHPTHLCPEPALLSTRTLSGSD